MEKLQVQEWEATLRTHLDLVCVRVQEVSKCFDFNFKKLLVLACLCFETFFGCEAKRPFHLITEATVPISNQ